MRRRLRQQRHGWTPMNYLKKKRGRKGKPKFLWRGASRKSAPRKWGQQLLDSRACVLGSKAEPQRQHSNWPSCHWPPEAEVPTSLPGLDSDPQLRESGIIDLNSRIPRHHAGPPDPSSVASPHHDCPASRNNGAAPRYAAPSIAPNGDRPIPVDRRATKRTGATETDC